MELWDLYDAQRQPMNKLQMRGKPIPEGCYHIVVFIWTFTYDGKLLLTKRDACKPGGLLWEVTGGSVLHGESSQEGAKRELYEETGISCRVEQLQKLHKGAGDLRPLPAAVSGRAGQAAAAGKGDHRCHAG